PLLALAVIGTPEQQSTQIKHHRSIYAESDRLPLYPNCCISAFLYRVPCCPACLVTSGGVAPPLLLAALCPPLNLKVHQLQKWPLKPRSPSSSWYKHLCATYRDKMAGTFWTFQPPRNSYIMYRFCSVTDTTGTQIPVPTLTEGTNPPHCSTYEPPFVLGPVGDSIFACAPID
ncbi:hypothetical protein XELAEV_180028122mg, partial [Xenopus laevis]